MRSLVYLFAILLLGSYLTAPISDPNFYFHLGMGQSLLKNGFPHECTWTLLGLGKPWINASWYYDLLLAQAEPLFHGMGLTALALLTTMLFALSTGMLFRSLSPNGAIAFVVSALVICGVLERWELSPELFAWTFLVLGCFSFSAKLSKGLQRFALFLSALALANSHPSFFLLPLFVLFLGVGGLAETLIRLGLLLGAAFLTPSLGAEMQQWIRLLLSEISFAVQFQDVPGTVFLFRFAFLFLLWILVALLSPREEVFQEKRLAILAGLLSLLGLVHRDMLPYAILPTGMLLASLLNRIYREEENPNAPPLLEALRRLSVGLSRIPLAGGVWLLLCLLIVNIASSLKLPRVDAFLPRQAVDSIVEKNLPGPLLHEDVVAPYLVYRFLNLPAGHEPLATFDSSLPLYSSAVATAERSMRSLQPSWDELLQALRPKTVLCRKNSTLFLLMAHSEEWKQVYEDEFSLGNLEELENPERTKDLSKNKKNFAWVVFQKKS